MRIIKTPAVIAAAVLAISAALITVSPASASSSKAVPSAPQELTPSPGNEEIVLRWKAPSNNGGSSITGYRVYRAADSGGPWTLVGRPTGTFHRSSDLVNGQKYWFRVRAVNKDGEGTAATVSARPRTIPGSPTFLKATPGDRQVALTWTAPNINGGEPVSSYTVYTAASSGGPWTKVGTSNKTSYTANNLTNGALYWFRVNAVNPAGEGPGSSPVSSSPRTIPGAPQTLTATTPLNNQIALAWFPPVSTGGAPITHYLIYRATSASGPWTVHARVNTNKYTDLNLPPEVTYWYRVTASNLAGESTHGNTVSAMSLGLFTAPTVTSVIPVKSTSEQMSITFTPGAAGGRTITGYEYSTNGGSIWQPVSSWNGVTVFTDPSLTTVSGGYSYRLRAVASNGHVSLSSPAIVKPSTTTLSVTALKGKQSDNGASVDISAVVPTAADYIKIYRVTNNPTRTPWNLIAPTLTDNKLAWATLHGYQVAACNAGGCSPYSSQATVTTAPTPTSFKLTKPSSSSIKVTVSSLPTGVQSYRIKYCNRSANSSCDPDESPEGTIIQNAAGSYTLTGLKNSANYAIVVVSCASTGGRGLSTTSSAKTI